MSTILKKKASGYLFDHLCVVYHLNSLSIPSMPDFICYKIQLFLGFLSSG